MPDRINFISLSMPEHFRPEQSEQSEKNNYLYLFLSGCSGPRVSYAICIVKTKLLLTNTGEAVEFVPSVPKPISLTDNGKGMGCGNIGSKLFFIGGQKPQDNSQGTKGEEDLAASSSRVFVYDSQDGSTDPQQEYEFDSLLLGKCSPLVLSVDEKSLYVLAQAQEYVVPDVTFEKYTCEKDEWKASRLPCPPFLDPNCKYFEDSHYCAHAVIDNKIHVSTSSSSFSFDTTDEKTEEKWNTCPLFAERKKKARPWTDDIQYPPPFEWMNYPNKSGKQSCRGGPSFDFNCGSVLLKKGILISVVLSEGVVCVHKLNKDDEIVNTEPLKGINIPTRAISACLADLGRDYLCLVSSCFNPYSYYTWITLMSFRVDVHAVVAELETSNLQTKPAVAAELKTFYLQTSQIFPSADQLWSCINCFSMTYMTMKEMSRKPSPTH